MGPKIVVLYGGYAFERVRNLLNGMVNVPLNLNEFGRVMGELMCGSENTTSSQVADTIQHFVCQFKLPNEADPGFDERIVYEALTFGAGMFRKAWNEQIPTLSCEGYRFSRWLGADLVLERRDSL